MRFRPHSIAVTILTLGLVTTACGDSEDTNSGNKKKGQSGGSGGEGGNTSLDWKGAHGIVINQVAFYQGVKRVLMQNGAPTESAVPIIPNRPALMRVFYTADANYNAQPVQAQLLIDGFEPILVDAPVLSGSSQEAALESTLNFNIPPEYITDNFTYQVKIVQAPALDELGSSDGGNPSATYPIGTYESLLAGGPANTLRLILAPFQYNADGSGRVPDLSPEKVEAYRQRFMQWYPVSAVEVTVRAAQPWNKTISPSGGGWEDALIATYGFRAQDGAPATTYYYGVFQPTQNIYNYCSGGCLLGLTLQNDTNDPSLRFAIGVGYDEVAHETAAHEIGHAHGRLHVNCGYGVDPNSVDYAYPHPVQQIGTWGWDMFTNQLVNPATHTDFMGYCEENWISDHTYIGLHNRGAAINAADFMAGDVSSRADEDLTDSLHATTLRAPDYDVLSVGADSGRFIDVPVGSVGQDNQVSGEPVEVTVLNAQGHARSVQAAFVRFTHLPGGWVFVPKDGPAGEVVDRAEVVIDDHFVVAQR